MIKLYIFSHITLDYSLVKLTQFIQQAKYRTFNNSKIFDVNGYILYVCLPFIVLLT